jgi:hypothetical protein
MACARNDYVPSHQPTGAGGHGRGQDGRYEGGGHLFSVDYPFGNNMAAVAFLKNLPVSPEDREKIAHQNADALLRLSLAN